MRQSFARQIGNLFLNAGAPGAARAGGTLARDEVPLQQVFDRQLRRGGLKGVRVAEGGRGGRFAVRTRRRREGGSSGGSANFCSRVGAAAQGPKHRRFAFLSIQDPLYSDPANSQA